MKHNNILYFILIISFFGYAQNDSIQIYNYEEQLEKASHDTVKIRLYKELARIYVDREYKKSVELEELALSLSKKYADDLLILESLVNLGEYYQVVGNYDESLEILKEAESLNTKIKGKPFDAKICIHKAWTYKRIRKMDSAGFYGKKALELNKNATTRAEKIIEINSYLVLSSVEIALHNKTNLIMDYLFKALKIAEELDYTKGLLTIYDNIALRLMLAGNLDRAIYYTKKENALAKKINNLKSEAYSYRTFAEIYYDKEQFDSSLVYAHKAINIFEKNKDVDVLPTLYRIVGSMYSKLDKVDEAIEVYKKIIPLDKTANNYHSIYTSILISETYVEEDNIPFAKAYLDTAISYSKGIKDIWWLDIIILNTHSLIYEKEKDFEKAFHYYKLAEKLHDSLDDIASNKKVSELEANYQFEKNEQQIASLNAKNKVKNLQLYLLIGFITLVLLVLFIIYIRYRTNKETKEKLEELDKMKTRFFTNISHEFRTPLSLIIGYFQQRMEDVSDENEKRGLVTPYKNAERLHSLINQLLDLSKLESGNMPLMVAYVDVNEFLKIIFSFFISKAEENNIKYTCYIDPQIKNGYLDKDKIEKITTNLLSNAFKFTKSGNTIHFNASLIKKRLIISISDTGIGISPTKLGEVFNRFYQVDSSSTRMVDGSGVGLALSKELVEVHKGSLTVTSVLEKGSEFKFEIPINKEKYITNELVIEDIGYNSIKPDFIKPENEANKDFNKEKELVLIVEDNKEMQSFISGILKRKYNVISALNGSDAFNLALNEMPDIIVSDYMMPKMNGLELCEKIKNNEITNHIPVVILTAKAGQESKLKGLAYGADSYLTKPFNNKELVLVIRNLLKQKEKIKEVLSKSILSIEEVSLPASEKCFFEKMMIHFEENYNKSSFGVDQLAENLCLSRSQLYRKIKNVTGKTPSDLLRNFRMEKAKKMLSQSSKNVGQVAIEVGFCNQSNFSKNFKNFTGFSPIDYINKYVK